MTSQTILSDIKSIVRRYRADAAMAINQAMIHAYWEVGQRIVQEEQEGSLRAEYGSRMLAALSRQLTEQLGKGFSPRSLAYYRQLYLCYPDWEILHTRVQNLSWSHMKVLLRVDDPVAREWYMRESAKQMWSQRTLDRNVASQYYYRLLSSPTKEETKAETPTVTAVTRGEGIRPEQFIKTPLVTEFLGLPSDNSFTEKDLEGALLSHLQQFMMELGKGFAFVERQQHIVTDTEDYYIDLVFYNYILKCFVLIDLKTSKITHQDVGQMDMYVRMYDDLRRTEGDNPTIGILLCAETSQDIARYSVLHDNNQLFATKYLTYLPSKEQLRDEIERQKALFYEHQCNPQE